MEIICLAGDYESGKSTLAMGLSELIGDSTVIPLAEAVRKELVELGLHKECVYGKPTSSTIREFMHTWGEARRSSLGRDYWVQRWHFSAILSQKSVVICDDMRFVEDFEAFQKLGLVTLYYLGDSNEGYDLVKLKELADCVFPVKPNPEDVLNDYRQR